MFSNVSANTSTIEKASSWDNIFSLAVDQYYDESQDKEQCLKEESNYFKMDLSFDDECDSTTKADKDLSDYESTDNESVSSRSASCISINCFYASENVCQTKSKFSSLLAENYMNSITEVKNKANEVINAQKVINAKKMVMVSMFQKQAFMQMKMKMQMAATAAAKVATEQTTVAVAEN